MRAIRTYARPFTAIVVLGVIAVLVAAYIFAQQGNRFPLVSSSPVRMTAVLSTAQGVTPGQSQSVQVAGVIVGKIHDVKLRDGRAVLQLDMDRKYVQQGLVRTDAHALLRPRSPLKDMYLQVFPGSWQQPAAGKGFQIRVANTLPDVDTDQVLAQLDQRTRDYLQLLVTGTGRGLDGRGSDLAEVFRRFGPTTRDLGRVNRSVSRERVALRQTVGALSRLNGRLAQQPKQLSGLVSSASQTFRAFASEDGNLRQTVTQLPGTLRRATVTLDRVRPLASALQGAATAGVPVVKALQRANPALIRLGRQATPQVRTQIRPFVRAARPLARDLVPAAQALAPAFPELTRDTAVVNVLGNLLGYNQNGREAAGKPGRDEGYLFWLAWLTHLGNNLINVDDANGPQRPVFLSGTCATLTSLVNFVPQLEFGMALSPVLAGLCDNPATASVRRGPNAKKGKG